MAQARLGSLKYFMVGCGALGCELLKNFAMMGVASGADGRIFVTDDDVIEKSNLSRQFLFRNHNVGQSKSQAASRAILGMNPALKIDARQVRGRFSTGVCCSVKILVVVCYSTSFLILTVVACPRGMQSSSKVSAMTE